jgi:hypothetical protein
LRRLTGNMRKHFSSFPFRVLPSRSRTASTRLTSCPTLTTSANYPSHIVACPTIRRHARQESPESSLSPPTTGCNLTVLSLQVGNGTTTKPSSAAICPGVSLSVVICRSYEGGRGGRTGSCPDFNNGDGSIGTCDME